MVKNRKIRIAAMILLSVMTDIFLHIVTASFSSMPKDADLSLLAGLLGTELTASVWALLAFSGAAFVYLSIQNEIPGMGVKKGLRYGTSIALLWLCAMLEGASLFGNSVRNEFIVGLSDAIPVFILSVLLSLLKAEKTESGSSKAFTLYHKIRTVSLFAVIFLTGRYAAYLTGVIQSGNSARPLETFTWTLLMGISIGIAFILLVNKSNARSLKHSAVKFGFLIFGFNWAAFLVFMPFLLSGYMADVLLRILIDTTLVTVSSHLARIWFTHIIFQ